MIEEKARPILSHQTSEVLGVLKSEINSIKEHDIFEEYKIAFQGWEN